MGSDVNDFEQGGPNISIHEALASVLCIARDHRWVSDFLFGDLLQTHFHREVPLTPAMFGDALTADLRVRIKVWPELSNKPRLPNSLANDLPSDGIDDTLLHTAFVPVAVVGTLAVGYAFAAHEIPRGQCMPHSPLVPPFVARFVLDFRNYDLVFINRGGKPPSIGIRAMQCSAVDPTIREHFSFIVPDAPYSWPYLPTAAIWMMSHSEKPVIPSPSMHSVTNNALMFTSSSGTPDRTPWSFSRNGALADGLLPSFGPISDPTSGTTSSSFSITQRATAASALRRFLSGSFRSSAFRIDSLNALTGTLNSCFTGPVVSDHAVTAGETAQVITHRFVHAYFATILSVTCDKELSPTSTNIMQQACDGRQHAPPESSPVSSYSKTGNSGNQLKPSEFWRTLLVDAHNFGVKQKTTNSETENETGAKNTTTLELAHTPSSIEKKAAFRSSATSVLNDHLEFEDLSANNRVLGDSSVFDSIYEEADKPNDILCDVVAPNNMVTDSAVANVNTAEEIRLIGLIDTIVDHESTLEENGIGENYDCNISSTNNPKFSNVSNFSTEICEEGTNSSNPGGQFDLLAPIANFFVNDLVTIPHQNNSIAENAYTAPNNTMSPNTVPDSVATAQITKRRPRHAQVILPRGTPNNPVGLSPPPRSKEQVLADRKRRNRLSAARSNERRRFWEAQLALDLQTERKRMKELEARLQVVHNEHDFLQQRVQDLEQFTNRNT